MKKVDKVIFLKDAVKFLQKADKNVKDKIKEGIEKLKTIPAEGDIKTLEGYNDGRMRLRIGKYRVIYRYEENNLLVLYIMDIGSRGDIYK